MIIHKQTGQSDCQHLDHLMRLHRVMTQKIVRDEGRGKTKRSVKVYKYNTKYDTQIRNTIQSSIKHYQELCSSSDNTNGQ